MTFDFIFNGGGSIDGSKSDVKIMLSEIFDRPPIMKKMEELYDNKLKPSLASAASFKKNADEIKHNAELLAVLGVIIVKEDYESWDDESFLEYANIVRDSSKRIVDSIELNDYKSATTASGKIFKSCSECHEGYRG